MSDEKGKMFPFFLWHAYVVKSEVYETETKKPPVGGLIETRKMFSGISPERQKLFSGNFCHC